MPPDEFIFTSETLEIYKREGSLITQLKYKQKKRREIYLRALSLFPFIF